MRKTTSVGGATYWSVTRAAEYIGCDRSTIYRWIQEGRIRAHQFGPHMTRLKATDVRALISFAGEVVAE